MPQNKNRYFIELQLDTTLEIPRNREIEIRRAQAADFIAQLASWLQHEELKERVSSVAITALGQVQITCDQDIITRLKRDEAMPIVAIRQGTSLTESIHRIGAR